WWTTGPDASQVSSGPPTAGVVGQPETLVASRVGGVTTLKASQGGATGYLQFSPAPFTPAYLPLFTITDVVGDPTGAGLLSFVANGAPFDLMLSDFSSVPLLENDSYIVLHDHTLQASAASGVLANDSGWDPGDTTVTVIQGVQHGTLTLLDDGS